VDPLLRSTLVKLLLPALGIVVLLTVTKRRGLSWREDLGLAWPSPRVFLLWIALWVAWVAASEVAIAALGIEPPAPWKPYPLYIVVMRVVAIGLIGPALEELVVRGLLFGKLSRTRLGPWGAIGICAAAWAVVHTQYDWKTMALIFLDGIVLGTARYRSRSTFVPMAMHMLGNLYSIYQSLHG